MFTSSISLLLCFFCVLLSVAFVTLFERHILSSTQNRIGPNKSIIFGVSQPLLDGVKLLMKEEMYFYNSFVFMLGPMLAFIIMIMEWTTLPLLYANLSFNHSILFFMCCIGLMVYTTLISGVASGSKYSFIGGVRSACQTVSYEVAIVLVLLITLTHFHSFEFFNAWTFLWWVSLFFWGICFLAETNRAPFDFSEGESELVSGFNTEYSSVFFVFLFLSEYGSIVLLSYMTSAVWFGGIQFISFVIFGMVILVRSSFPRFRYDFLMQLVWFTILPISIFILCLSLSI